MAHQAKVIDARPVADGIIAIKARCCGEKTTDSVLSLYHSTLTDEEVHAYVQSHLSRVEETHASQQRAIEIVGKLFQK